jgi:hypothetical protein
MEKKILIKEIDKYTNLRKDKTISEYLVYYIVNERNVEALNAYGEKEKALKVNEILLKHFVNENNINLEHATYPIEEIKL